MTNVRACSKNASPKPSIGPNADGAVAAAEIPLSQEISAEITVAESLRDIQEGAYGPCRNLVRVKEVYIATRSRPYNSWYTMEPVQGCTLAKLKSHVNNIPAWLVAHILTETVEGMKWMHGAGWTHNDLHGANVMLALEESTPRVYVVDLGGFTKLTKLDEIEDCRSLVDIIRMLVEDSTMGSGGRKRDRNDDDENKRKREMLVSLNNVVKAASSQVGDRRMVHDVWQDCGALFERIRDDRQELPDDVKTVVENAIISDQYLEDLIEKGGQAVKLIPNH